MPTLSVQHAAFAFKKKKRDWGVNSTETAVVNELSVNTVCLAFCLSVTIYAVEHFILSDRKLFIAFDQQEPLYHPVELRGTEQLLWASNVIQSYRDYMGDMQFRTAATLDDTSCVSDVGMCVALSFL